METQRTELASSTESILANRNASYPNREHNDRNVRIFTERLKEWREWLVDLQRRLCGDVISIALANRGVLGRDPLDWANECVDNYWATRRPGFKNWAVLGCDWAEPEGWSAPGWLLSQVPQEFLDLHIETSPLAETFNGRVFAPYTLVILEQISSLIEMRVHMARTAVFDDAKIKIASQPAARMGKQSSVASVNEAVYAIGRRYGYEWNKKWLESTRELYAELHPTQVKSAGNEPSPDVSEDKGVLLKGKRCHEVIAEIRKIKNLVSEFQDTVSGIRHGHPDFQVWQIADGLPDDEKYIFNHPRQWGPVVGYARNLLAKDYGCKPDTIRKWVGAYRKANPDKRTKKTGPKKSRSKSQ
jgi:hypothetical protein